MTFDGIQPWMKDNLQLNKTFGGGQPLIDKDL